MNILITGVAGFIGFHLAKELSKNRKNKVYGIDNLNSYYDLQLKKKRIAYLKKNIKITFHKLDINNFNRLKRLFLKYKITHVLHFAAQPGVRYSISHPMSYIDSNLVGFQKILECCRTNNIKHLVYASSSSVYGLNKKHPYNTNDNTDHPISLYAVTKKSNELAAHSYSHLYGLPTTGLRLFTVYGPWGRPDMALFKFTNAIYKNKVINVFNNGNHKRDFTYIDDVVKAISKIINLPPKHNSSWKKNYNTIHQSSAPYTIYNVGAGKAVKLLDFIKIIEKVIGKNAKIRFQKRQPGDVEITYSNSLALKKNIQFKSSTALEEGVQNFIEWYINIYK